MSNTKRYWADTFAERAENAASEKLAKILNISQDELNEVDWEIVADQNKDGFIYGYYVNFGDESNPKILERCGADEDGTVYLNHDIFEEPEDYDYYEEELAWERESNTHFSDFNSSLDHIRSLADLPVPDSEHFSLLVMMYMHTVSSFEHLLYRCFQYEISRSEENTKKFVESNPEFKQRKFTLDQIFKKREDLDEVVAECIKDVIFHRIDKVIPMYRSVLGFDFGDASWMADAIKHRHDCAHRAGHNKNGEKLALTKQSILDLATRCSDFAKRLEEHLQQLETDPFFG